MNFLSEENCNKTHCKSCIFHPDFDKRINLEENRINEIKKYLSEFQSSHICHNTNKTCYGGLQFQANILFAMNIIEENSVESLLLTAKNYLK